MASRPPIGTFVVTVGKDETPATHYLSGWSVRSLAERSARQFRQFGMRRPVKVVEVTEENCCRLIARGGWCGKVCPSEGGGTQE